MPRPKPQVETPWYYPWPDPATSGVPRDINGNFAGMQGGRYFPLGQGECWMADGPLADSEALFGIVQLETGEWLSDGFIWGPRHPNRASALQACAERIAKNLTERVIGYEFNGRWCCDHTINRHKAEGIIRWACRIAEIPEIAIPARHHLAPQPDPKPAPEPDPQGCDLSMNEPAQLELI